MEPEPEKTAPDVEITEVMDSFQKEVTLREKELLEVDNEYESKLKEERLQQLRMDISALK